ncbi:bifunctional diaminohydroxyphosphoribosylaminopyrimidine deaminase/5-amino-6-(5-phosphoribosylamino)uracil reductase RibD [Campylobacterota bacterium]
MKLALNAAWQFQGLTYPNPAVGCTIVQNGAVIAVGAHAKAGEPHAEVIALKEAYMALSIDRGIEKLTKADEIHDYLLKHHNGIFLFCEMYITLEPCTHEGKTPSCSNLIQKMRPQKIYISHYDPNPEATGGAQALISGGMNVEYGLCEEEGKALLDPFIKWNDENFVLFKWAQRLDGTIDGGLISDETSRKKVHAIREHCDLIVIGGNTVRTDRPTLDARLVDGKAPDVLIYSNREHFDRNIPLFNIEGRKVFIENSFDRVKSYKNVLIEGGPSMFDATKEITDRYLCFLAPKTGGDVAFTHERLDLKILQSSKLDNDLMIWMEK